MPFILSIETSTTVCSVAVHKDGELVTCCETHTTHSHSRLLTVLVEQACTLADVELDAIDAVAISQGPGSYTGLRIGTSAAKGYCFVLGKPLIAVPTLAVLTENVRLKYPFSDALFCPMLDARRMEVYCALYNSDLNIVQETEAKIITEHSFANELAIQNIVFFGNGAGKCKPMLGSKQTALFLDDLYPSAAFMGKIAFAAYEKGEFEDGLF